MNFASDNTVGASAPVLQAIVQANAGAMAAYGNDEISRRVRAQFNEIFEREVSVFFATTGTAANALALSSAVPLPQEGQGEDSETCQPSANSLAPSKPSSERFC